MTLSRVQDGLPSTSGDATPVGVREVFANMACMSNIWQSHVRTRAFLVPRASERQTSNVFCVRREG